MNEYSFKGEKTSLRTLLSLLTTCNHDTAEEIITEIEKVSPVRAEKARHLRFLVLEKKRINDEIWTTYLKIKDALG